MRISVFNNYRVDYKCRYSVKLGEDEFSNEEITKTFNIDGCKLYDSLSKLFNDQYIVDCIIQDNEIAVSEFDPLTGESSDYYFTIHEDLQTQGD